MTPDEYARDCERIAGITGNFVMAACDGQVEDALREGVYTNFDTQSNADGVAWPPRKRIGDGHPLLDDTGALKAAATQRGALGSVSKVEGDTLTIGVDAIPGGPGGLPGARRHQYGDDVPGIPARPYMEVDDACVDDTSEIVADAIMELIG